MLDKFLNYIETRSLVSQQDVVVLGVSGGRDSMVMLDLCVKAGLRIAVAHCNFSLRGAESDADQAFVEKRAAEYGVPLHVVRFDTQEEASRCGESIQMAARRLRYDWFEELCLEYGYSKIAIAHHADDSIETVFINMVRGTGLRGMTGISSQNGRIIRPLLFAHRDDITRYTADAGITYRDDSSNDSIKYLRNRLRHEILPLLNSSSNSFTDTMSCNIERMEQAQRFVDTQVARIKSEVMEQGRLDLLKLRAVGDMKFLLFEILYPYGFPSEMIESIREAIERGHSGKRFFTSWHTLLLDRDALLLSERRATHFEQCELAADDPRVEWLTIYDFDTLHTPSNVALLSADELNFPLQLRRWRDGDWFIPLGMRGQKKVSDFLIDAKVSLTDKETQGVLMSNGQIIWLVGRRIDERYKVRESTKKVVRITLD